MFNFDYLPLTGKELRRIEARCAYTTNVVRIEEGELQCRVKVFVFPDESEISVTRFVCDNSLIVRLYSHGKLVARFVQSD